MVYSADLLIRKKTRCGCETTKWKMNFAQRKALCFNAKVEKNLLEMVTPQFTNFLAFSAA